MWSGIVHHSKISLWKQWILDLQAEPLCVELLNTLHLSVLELFLELILQLKGSRSLWHRHAGHRKLLGHLLQTLVSVCIKVAWLESNRG